jgi:hypothetical protein
VVGRPCGAGETFEIKFIWFYCVFVLVVVVVFSGIDGIILVYSVFAVVFCLLARSSRRIRILWRRFRW